MTCVTDHRKYALSVTRPPYVVGVLIVTTCVFAAATEAVKIALEARLFKRQLLLRQQRTGRRCHRWH